MAVPWLLLDAGILCQINGFPSMSCLTLRSSMKAGPIPLHTNQCKIRTKGREIENIISDILLMSALQAFR